MTNKTATIQSKSFKATYLRLLSGETPLQADYWAARELIDQGHATGRYQVTRAREEHGKVITLLGFAPTLSGRLLADDLADELRSKTLRYRLMQGGIAVLSFGGGWVAGVASQVAASVVAKVIGAG